MALYEKTAHELAVMLRAGQVSAEEITRAIIDRIEEVEGKVRSYVTVTDEQALEQARAADARRAKGEHLPPLCGIPVAIKDNMCTRGIRTTAASRILENFVPPYNATVVDRLEAQGAVIIGKTNMDEFAMGSSCENSGFFPTHNPWDLSRVPGGSSGGSAAAVAADETILALGSDTGGSIRQPASFCGVVGLKPTYGYVSRYGLIAFASSLDQIGPITKDVEDAALLMNAIAGHDPFDSTSAEVNVPDFTSFLRRDIKGMKLGVPKEYWAVGMDPQVKQLVKGAVEVLAGLGAEIEECSLPHTEYALAAYYLIAPAEASSNLARYDGVKYGYRTAQAEDLLDMYQKTRREGFGPEVKRRIMLGTYALSAGYYDAYYLKAQKVRTLVKQDFEQAFSKYDALLTPTSPVVAFKLGERVDDPMSMYLADICTIPVNLAGIPGLSIPCGFVNDLPVGLQILGKPFDEGTIFRIAHAYEQASGFPLRKPQLKGGRDI